MTAQLKLQEETAVPEIEALDTKNSTGVAVDEGTSSASGTVYVDNVTGISAFTPSGTPIQEFGELKKGTGVAVDAATNTVYVTDASTNTVNVFVPEGSGAPQINEVSAQNITPTETKLIAQIDPHGIQTEYTFEYGTVNCGEHPSECTKVAGAGPLAAEFGDKEVSVTVTNLAPSTTYHYRVVATNTGGEVALESTLGTFTTLPSAGGLLADNRQWELVSPAIKDGSAVEPLDFGVSGTQGGVSEASEDGNAVTYAANGPIEGSPEGNRAFEGVQVISTRSPQGWTSKQIVTPNEKATGLPAGEPQEYRFFSRGLESALVEPVGVVGSHMQEPPLVSPEGEERGIYMRNNLTCPATCYEALVNGADESTGVPFGGELKFVSATPDLKHVIFKALLALTSTAPIHEEGGLYEWNAPEGEDPATLTYVSVVQKTAGAGKAVPSARLGANEEQAYENDRNAISEDGSRVFFETENEEETENHPFLYMRDVPEQQDDPGQRAGSRRPARNGHRRPGTRRTNSRGQLPRGDRRTGRACSSPTRRTSRPKANAACRKKPLRAQKTSTCAKSSPAPNASSPTSRSTDNRRRSRRTRRLGAGHQQRR